ncbi:MAG: hypothetical protein IPJ74_25505 [Saprospiraceae bacterium]|nr:hypothetical protein [Saprospiraceae bacterium]
MIATAMVLLDYKDREPYNPPRAGESVSPGWGRRKSKSWLSDQVPEVALAKTAGGDRG